MKHLLRFVFVFVILFTVNSNAQLKDCNATEAEIGAAIKARNFSQAYIQWSESQKCLGQSELLFTYGEQILEDKIDNAPSEEKQKLINDLLSLYIAYDKSFSANTKSNRVKRAMMM